MGVKRERRLAEVSQITGPEGQPDEEAGVIGSIAETPFETYYLRKKVDRVPPDGVGSLA
jgi:hypothetical protein